MKYSPSSKNRKSQLPSNASKSALLASPTGEWNTNPLAANTIVDAHLSPADRADRPLS
jgi:hypothetical protein